MTDPYQILGVWDEWVRDPEDMGSKKKFWFRFPGEPAGYWLFKYPKANTGEHWAEKIAAEIAGLVDIECAKVELATFGNEQGSVSKAFTGVGRELVHGNQMLATFINNYDPEATFHHSGHTLANIWKVMERVFGDSENARDLDVVKSEAVLKAKRRIAEYVVLDALIGNTDRHHENWGILRRQVNDHWKGFVAPSYDHASSLGRELLDVRRERCLAEKRLGNYAEKGRGAIYWSENSKRGPSPLELVRQAVRSYPGLFHPVGMKLKTLDERVMEEIVNRIPDNWMSSSAREFAIALMCYNSQQLQELFP